MNVPPADVAAVFETYPPVYRAKLLEIRAVIFQTATDAKVGDLTECLKWGQPSYLTAPKIGSTIRLGWSEKSPDRASVYFICHTDLVERFRDLYPDGFRFDANRVIYFTASDEIPAKPLSHCLSMALTYHRDKA